jgi:hypothetical protein
VDVGAVVVSVVVVVPVVVPVVVGVVVGGVVPVDVVPVDVVPLVLPVVVVPEVVSSGGAHCPVFFVFAWHGGLPAMLWDALAAAPSPAAKRTSMKSRRAARRRFARRLMVWGLLRRLTIT